MPALQYCQHQYQYQLPVPVSVPVLLPLPWPIFRDIQTRKNHDTLHARGGRHEKAPLERQNSGKRTNKTKNTDHQKHTRYYIPGYYKHRNTQPHRQYTGRRDAAGANHQSPPTLENRNETLSAGTTPEKTAYIGSACRFPSKIAWNLPPIARGLSIE